MPISRNHRVPGIANRFDCDVLQRYMAVRGKLRPAMYKRACNTCSRTDPVELHRSQRQQRLATSTFDRKTAGHIRRRPGIASKRLSVGSSHSPDCALFSTCHSGSKPCSNMLVRRSATADATSCAGSGRMPDFEQASIPQQVQMTFSCTRACYVQQPTEFATIFLAFDFADIAMHRVFIEF